MRRSKILDLKGFHSAINFLSANKLMIVLSLFLLLGIFLGVFLYGDFSLADGLTEAYFEEFLTERSNSGILKIISDSFFEMLLCIVISFIFGTSMLGTVVLPISIFVKGYFCGYFSALLYSQYSLKGIAFHTVLVLPIAVAFSVLLVFVIRASIRFSIILIQSVLSDSRSVNLTLEFKSYCLSFLGFIIGAFVIALADGLLSYNLINVFSI